MNNYTHTIFKSKKCQFDMITDYKKVTCTQDICVNDILLIEHCYYQKKDNFYILENSIRYDKDLFNGLYPRDVVWKEEYVISKIGHDIERKKEFLISEISPDIR